jgi:secreted trypsin-like serine protease
MKLRVSLVALLAAALVLAAGLPASAIVGGEPVTYPWAVAVARSGAGTFHQRAYCSGVLIKPSYVLTAAHCNVAVNHQVAIGRGPIGTGGELRTVTYVARMYDNATYCPSRDTVLCDLALLLLNSPSTRQDLNLANEQVLSQWGIGTAARAYGYGRTSATAAMMSDHLRRADTQITDFRDNHHTMFAKADAGQAVCYGDSGGPLVVSTSLGPRIVGIIRAPTSTDSSPCSSGDVASYVKVGWRGSAANSAPFRWVSISV